MLVWRDNGRCMCTERWCEGAKEEAEKRERVSVCSFRGACDVGEEDREDWGGDVCVFDQLLVDAFGMCEDDDVIWGAAVQVTVGAIFLFWG